MRGHGCVSVVSVVCCQVSTIGQLFIQTSPTECGMSNECDRGDELGQATTQDRVAKAEENRKKSSFNHADHSFTI